MKAQSQAIASPAPRDGGQTNGRSTFVLDTSALLHAWRRAYPPKTFPGLWRRLGEAIAAGHLITAEEVHEELKKKDDEVLQWLKLQPRFVVPLDERQQEAVTAILTNHARLVDDRKGRSQGDPFVIALALVESGVVVTQEQPASRQVKIPDVCDALGIRWINLMQLLEELGWVFE